MSYPNALLGPERWTPAWGSNPGTSSSADHSTTCHHLLLLHQSTNVCVCDYAHQSTTPALPLSLLPCSQTRLKELAQDLLGPERWTPAWGSNPWDHLVLGMDKRQLLRTAVIPVMASFGLKLVTQVGHERDLL